MSTADPAHSTAGAAAPIHLAASAWAGIVDAAERAAPDECCGLLLGDVDRLALAWPAANVAPNRRVRYEIDPRDHFAALRHARAAGLALVGGFHSHPRTPPEPSASDRAEALDHFVYLIAGRHPGASWTARVFVLIGGNFVERPLVFDA